MEEILILSSLIFVFIMGLLMWKDRLGFKKSSAPAMASTLESYVETCSPENKLSVMEVVETRIFGRPIQQLKLEERVLARDLLCEILSCETEQGLEEFHSFMAKMDYMFFDDDYLLAQSHLRLCESCKKRKEQFAAKSTEIRKGVI